MDNLNSLSDEELRLELVKYGFPNMPVTFTTRKILIKKLRRHLDEQKQKLRRESSAVLRYSSSEESDSGEGRKVTAAQRKSYAAPKSGTPGTAKRLGRSQRATVAGDGLAVPPPAVSSMPPPSVGPLKRTLLNSSISSPGSSSQHSFSNHGNSPFLGANGASGGGGKKSSHSPSQIYISPVLRHDHDEEDYSPSALWSSQRTYGSNPSPAPSYHSSLFRKTALAAQNITPPSASSSMYSNNNSGSSSTNNNNNSTLLNDSNVSNGSSGAGSAGGDSPPYVSEYTRRLMQLRGETVSQENYNSAIGGIIGRRSNPGGGIIPPSRYSTTPSPVANPMVHNSRAPIHPLHYRSIAGHFKLGSTGGSSSPSPPSPLVAGNHIRQRYSRVLGGAVGGQQHELDENDIVTHAQPSPEPPAIPFRVAIGNLITKLDEHYGFKQTFVPCALLCLLVAFLVSVALMYMTISTDLASTLSSIDTRYDLCDDSRSAGVLSGTDCVLAADVEPALELLKLVGSELKHRVEAYHCRRDPAAVAASAGGIETSSIASSIMSPGEVLQKAKEHSPSVLIPQLTRHLHAMEYLIDRNPQWHIDHCDADGQPITFAEVVERRPVKANHYTILKPKLPFGCMLYNKFQKFFVIVGGLALAALLAFVANYFYKFVVYVKQKRREQVSGLISEILHAVSQAAATASEAAMVANGATAPGTTVPDARVVLMHLRDRLLAPANRRKLGWAWNEAIQFLEQNESRIAFEVGSIGGEDFKMMRWIDTAPLASTVNVGSTAAATARISAGPAGAASCAKKWQSPAFDNSNKILDPPTPCLKIRQMFDRYEVNDPNLKTIVQDAILEKVGGRCKIYDIQLDRSSCCVYVRCASAKDAGIVHDEINGWWFDNRLVSIKFLRLERYLQRFPGSLSGSVCLKPSNKNNFSMSHQLAAGGGGGGGANGRGGVRSVNEDYDTEPEPEDDEDDDDDDEELVAAADAMDGPSIGIHGRRSASRRGREEDEEDEPEEDDEE